MGSVARCLPAVCGLAVAVSALGCGPRCREDVIGSASSPKADAVAEIVRENCGATTAFVEGVTISSKYYSLDKQLVFRYYHPAHIALHWESDYTLRIDCPDCVAADITTLIAVSKPFHVHATFPTDVSADQEPLAH